MTEQITQATRKGGEPCTKPCWPCACSTSGGGCAGSTWHTVTAPALQLHFAAVAQVIKLYQEDEPCAD